MKLILAGVGSFGRGWYRNIKKYFPQHQVVVVDTNSSAKALIETGDPFFTSLVDAIEQEHPDLLINVTPPQVHTQTDHIAFDHQLPVLCEKPIAEDFAEAVEVVGRAQVEGLPFMIAENYRRMAIMRRARQLLEEGAIGTLRSLHCVHYRSLYTEKPYFLRMKHPYLVDVVVHHLDLIRYLSGSEGRWIFARSYRPAESWHPGNLALDLSMEMENGVTASFSGNLITFGSETDWRGDWRIEGTMGTLVVTGKRICIFQGGKAVQVEDPGEKESLEDFQTPGPLVDFLAALKSNQEPETSARDYLKTQALVHFAIQSSETNRVIEVSLPQI